MTHTMIPRTNYLMEQESSLMQAQGGSDGSWYCWKDKSGWEKEGGPSRAMPKSLLLSVLHV